MGYTRNKPVERVTNMELIEALELPLASEVLDADQTMRKRGIHKTTLKHFGVRAEFDQTTGRVIAHLFPITRKGEIVGFIRRDLRKKKKDAFSVIGEGSPSDCDLLGQHVAPKSAKKIWVVEGIYDYLSAWQALYESEYNKGRETPIIPAVVSIGFGTANAREHIATNKDFLAGYGEVIICFDNDEATPEEAAKGIVKGKDATRQVALVLKDIKTVELDLNDPNEYLKEGRQKDLQKLLMFEAKEYKPEFIVSGGVGLERLLRPLEKGIFIPTFPETSRLLQGFRPMEMTVVLAPSNVGKCLGEGTLVRMFDGTLKPVEKIRPGDKLMGVDSNPRIVSSVTSGFDMLYKVKQSKGIDYVVNSAHILSLKASFSDGAVKKGDILNENVLDYMRSTKNHKRLYKGWRTGFDLPSHEYEHWYLLGLWIADGNADGPKIWINNDDKPIIDWLSSKYNIGHISEGSGCKGYYVKDYLPLKSKKDVDCSLLMSSRQQRLELLAGIIDGDGYCYGHGIEIVQKRRNVADFIVKLCHTLGIHVTETTKDVSGQTYIRLFITGEALADVPLLLERKKSARTNSTLSTLEIEEVGYGMYYGFTLEGSDRLFLLEDGTVTHNTTVCKEIGYYLVKSGKRVGHIFLEETIEKTQQSYLALDNNVPLPRFRSDPLIVPQDNLEQSYKDLIDNDRTMWLSHHGSINPRSLIEMLEWFYIKGMEFVILDHISMVFSGSRETNERKEIDNVLTELAAFVVKTNMHIIVVSHIKRLGFKPPKDKDGNTRYPYWIQVEMDDARGSGAFEQLAWNVISIEPERLEGGARGRIRTRVLKNREWGWLGMGDILTMHPVTGRLVLADNPDYVEVEK
jgi:replicative DNA helicase